MAMKTADSDKQKLLRKSHEDAKTAAQVAPAQTTVAPPATTSEDGLKLLVQARLSVSSPSDSFEHEAESMADEFVKSIHGRTVSAPTTSVGSVARSVPDNGLVEGSGGLATTDDTASAIMSARAGGQALSGDVRSRFEGFFGADLGGVKIHNDGTSDNLCRSINAEAFTTGNDVFFSSRSFKPGSSSGDHLLAHELTHVVQQGNAPTLSRRAMPDIQRVWYNPFSWGKKDTPKEDDENVEEEEQETVENEAPQADAPAGTTARHDGARQTASTVGNLIGLGQLPAGAAKADLQNPDITVASQQSADAKAAGNSVDSFGLIASTAALFSAMVRLVSEWNSESYASSRNQLVAAVKSGIDVAKNSTSLANTAGATIAAGAIPGLGLAINVIDLAWQCIKFDEVSATLAESKYKIEQLEEKADKTHADKVLLVSLRQLLESTQSEDKRTIVRITADFVGIMGQLLVLTGVGGIAGGVLVVTGAAMAGLTILQSKIVEWSSAGTILESRTKLAVAKAALEAHESKEPGDPELDEEEKAKLTKNVEDLSLENVGVDAYAAAIELIKYSAGAVDTEGNFDSEAVTLLSSFGLDANWLKAYRDSKDKDAMLDKGAKIICEFVGKAPNPLNLKQDLIKAAQKAWGAISFVASGAWYLVCWSGREMGRITVAGAKLGYEKILTPLWNAAMATPGLIWDFFKAAAELTASAGSAVGDAAVSGYEAVKKKIKGEDPPYFANEGDTVVRTAVEVTPIIKSYFAEKSARGTDVKPGSVTALLKAPYKKFVATAKVSHDDGSAPFAGADIQMSIVDQSVKNIICLHAPNRVDKKTVQCRMGNVEFGYVGGGKSKTRGMFAGLRGREAATNEEVLSNRFIEYGSPIE
jgi:hypothetical protein